MNIGWSELLVIGLLGLLFFKPADIKFFLHWIANTQKLLKDYWQHLQNSTEHNDALSFLMFKKNHYTQHVERMKQSIQQPLIESKNTLDTPAPNDKDTH